MNVEIWFENYSYTSGVYEVFTPQVYEYCFPEKKLFSLTVSLSRGVWKNALSITPNSASISFITTTAAAAANFLNITVLLSEPILRHGRTGFRQLGISAVKCHRLLQVLCVMICGRVCCSQRGQI